MQENPAFSNLNYIGSLGLREILLILYEKSIKNLLHYVLLIW